MSDDTKPLDIAVDSPSGGDDDRDNRFFSGKSRRRAYLIAFCCGIVVAVAVLVLVLALTVFRFRQPHITINALTVPNITTSPLSANITLVVDVSVKNRNSAAFKFGNSTAAIYHRGYLVGMAYVEPGSARPQRTFRRNVTIEVRTDQVMADTKLLSDVQSGAVGMQSSTRVAGRMKILGFIKHHVNVVMNCSAVIVIANLTVTDQHCHHHVRF